jgi:hypothetical protein
MCGNRGNAVYVGVQYIDSLKQSTPATEVMPEGDTPMR